MRTEGYPKFDVIRHKVDVTQYKDLWKALDAKGPTKGFGKRGMYKGTWEWFELWIDRVRAHCQEHATRYQ